MSDISLFKPSMTIANSVPLSARQLDFFNYLLKGAYQQLEKNYVLDTFIFSYEEIKKFNPRLKSVTMIEEFFQEIYDKEFEFNILGKDSTVESNVKSRFITVIKKNSTSETVELGLEPLSISILRKMVMKKKGIAIPGEKQEIIENLKNKKQKSHSYVYINITKELTFYPSKIVYELVHDYKNFIKEIDINDFKIITNTTDKYKANYTNMVINKIQKDLESLIKDFKIEAIKSGRAIKSIKITSSISNTNNSFDEFYENYLKEINGNDTIDNKKIAERIFKLSRGKNGEKDSSI